MATAFRPGFTEIQSILDPLFTYNWNVLFPTIPGSDDTRELSYKAISSEIPSSQIEQVPLETKGIKLNFAGRRMYTGTWQVTFVETRTASTRDKFLKWQDIARSIVTNSGSYKSLYAVTAELQLFDDVPNLVRSIRLLGCFPTEVGTATLDQSSSIVQYACTFSFDIPEESTE